MIDKHWLWCGSCPCGYQSRWYFAEWFARIVARVHGVFHRHAWGDLTIAAKGRNHRRKMFLVRLFGPKDPFHKRTSYFEKRKSGEKFAQISIGEWALMFGFFEAFDGMDRFLVVNSDVV